MARRDQSGLQRFVTRFVDAETARAMEAHSRAWRVRCPHCGLERSIWDLGGIRYGATGRTRMLARCQQCGRTGWHEIEKAVDFPTDKARVWPVVWLILSIAVAALILGAVLSGIILKLTGAA